MRGGKVTPDAITCDSCRSAAQRSAPAEPAEARREPERVDRQIDHSFRTAVLGSSRDGTLVGAFLPRFVVALLGAGDRDLLYSPGFPVRGEGGAELLHRQGLERDG